MWCHLRSHRHNRCHGIKERPMIIRCYYMRRTGERDRKVLRFICLNNLLSFPSIVLFYLHSLPLLLIFLLLIFLSRFLFSSVYSSSYTSLTLLLYLFILLFRILSLPPSLLPFLPPSLFHPSLSSSASQRSMRDRILAMIDRWQSIWLMILIRVWRC